jgi:hypothetical protein
MEFCRVREPSKHREVELSAKAVEGRLRMRQLPWLRQF